MPIATRPVVDNVKHRRQREESEQQKFINWLRREFPHVIAFSDVIGEDLTPSGRKRAFKQRTRRGIPDITILIPSREFHGCCLEFKPEGTKIYKKDGVTLRKQSYRYTINGRVYSGDHLQEQASTLMELNKAGYFARFAIGNEHAQKLFLWYLDVKENETLF